MTTIPESLLYHHIIVVMVGLSAIEKTLRAVDQDTYTRWMGEGGSDGQLATFNIGRVEQGEGSVDQLDVEKRCFNLSTTFNNIEREIPRKKRNRHSAEVSSLYMILTNLQLKPADCRIVLITTDSAEGVFAARLNKRIIAHRLLGCPENVARSWKSQADDKLHAQSLGRLTIMRVPDLQMQDVTKFRNQGKHAFEQLMQDINVPVIAGEKVLNITGGFKGVIPIAVWEAWRYGWDVTYLYEETDGLLFMPRHQLFNHVPPSTHSSLEMTLYTGLGD
jgi:hypothetical protein